MMIRVVAHSVRNQETPVRCCAQPSSPPSGVKLFSNFMVKRTTCEGQITARIRSRNQFPARNRLRFSWNFRFFSFGRECVSLVSVGWLEHKSRA